MSSVLHLEMANRIVWTPEEAKGLLDKAHAWWNLEEDHFREAKTPGIGALGFAEQVVSSFVEMLGLAVAPCLDPSAMEDGLRLLDALESNGVPTLAARVVFQGRNAAAPTLLNRIRAALALDRPGDRPVVWDALRAVAVWCVGDHGGTAPSDLLDDILVRILSRRRQENHLALRVVAVIVRRQFGAVRAGQRKLLDAVLEVLLVDTSLDLGSDNDVRSGLAPQERPEFRALAAALAGSLFAADKKVGVPPCGVLLRWQEVGEGDPLPEVRAAWRSEVTR
jgi:hypothetical protein